MCETNENNPISILSPPPQTMVEQKTLFISFYISLLPVSPALFLSLSLFLSFFLSLSNSLSLFIYLSSFRSLSLSLFLYLSMSIFLSLFLSHSLSSVRFCIGSVADGSLLSHHTRQAARLSSRILKKRV